MPSPYWNAQLAPLNGGLNNLASALYQTPRLRAQAALMEARKAQEQELMQEATARTGLLNTQDQRQQLSLSSALALANRFKQPGAISTDSKGNVVIDKNAIGDVMSAISGESKDSTDAAAGIANLLKSQNAPVQADLDRQNKSDIASASDAVRASRPIVVGSGGTLVTPTGTPLATGGVTLNQGQQRFAPQSLAGALVQSAPSVQSPVAINPPKPTPSAGKQEIRQVVNPARVVGGLVDTNQPPYLSLTNTTTPLDLSSALLSGTPAATNAISPPVGATSQIPTINSQADYDALPVGAKYQDSNGRMAVKKTQSSQ